MEVGGFQHKVQKGSPFSRWLVLITMPNFIASRHRDSRDLVKPFRRTYQLSHGRVRSRASRGPGRLFDRNWHGQYVDTDAYYGSLFLLSGRAKRCSRTQFLKVIFWRNVNRLFRRRRSSPAFEMEVESPYLTHLLNNGRLGISATRS